MEMDFEDETPYVETGWVAGGDASLQGCFCGYAIVAVEQSEIPALELAIDKVLSSYVPDVSPQSVEIHATDIWNGTARKKTPLSTITSKEEMQHFFVALHKAISQCKPLVACAVWHFGSQEDLRDARLMAVAKRTLINAAFGRINTNLGFQGRKDIGRPRFMFDPETEALMRPRKKGEQPGGFMPEISAIPISGASGKTEFKFRTKIDPIYLPSDSRASRLVQIADLAAYFTCKQLIAHSRLATYADSGKIDNLKEIENANFSLSQVELLNAETVLVVTPEEWRRQPRWMEMITHSYRGVFEAGVDLCICSMREAFRSAEDHRSRLCGLGYWSIKK